MARTLGSVAPATPIGLRTKTPHDVNSVVTACEATRMRFLCLVCVAPVLAACSSGSSSSSPNDGGTKTSDASVTTDAASDAPVVDEPDAGPQDTTCAGPCPTSAIKHIVIIVQENHTFDDHFGGYCTATPGSNPTCNVGPTCCEAMPATDPTGVKPTLLTDAEHAQFDPNHAKACELTEIDNGKMDGYAAASDAGCGSVENVAIADPTIVQPYWDLAAQGALGDRYFSRSSARAARTTCTSRARTGSSTTTTTPLRAPWG